MGLFSEIFPRLCHHCATLQLHASACIRQDSVHINISETFHSPFSLCLGNSQVFATHSLHGLPLKNMVHGINARSFFHILNSTLLQSVLGPATHIHKLLVLNLGNNFQGTGYYIKKMLKYNIKRQKEKNIKVKQKNIYTIIVAMTTPLQLFY